MSILSQAIHQLGDVFKSKVGSVDPAAQGQLTTAADALHKAGDAVGIAVPILAEQSANAALASLGPLGSIFAPAVDAFIEATCSALMRRHSASAPLPATGGASLNPVPLSPPPS